MAFETPTLVASAISDAHRVVGMEVSREPEAALYANTRSCPDRTLRDSIFNHGGPAN